MALVSSEQTAGRGRLDRQWVSPPGTSISISHAASGGMMRASTLSALSAPSARVITASILGRGSNDTPLRVRARSTKSSNTASTSSLVIHGVSPGMVCLIAPIAAP